MTGRSRCRALGCGRRVSREKLFCVRHWALLPGRSQERVCAAFSSPASLTLALREAIRYLAEQEGRSQGPEGPVSECPGGCEGCENEFYDE